MSKWVNTATDNDNVNNDQDIKKHKIRGVGMKEKRARYSITAPRAQISRRTWRTLSGGGGVAGKKNWIEHFRADADGNHAGKDNDRTQHSPLACPWLTHSIKHEKMSCVRGPTGLRAMIVLPVVHNKKIQKKRHHMRGRETALKEPATDAARNKTRITCHTYLAAESRPARRVKGSHHWESERYTNNAPKRTHLLSCPGVVIEV